MENFVWGSEVRAATPEKNLGHPILGLCKAKAALHPTR
jgi:hypothetical protein